jgi:hypothetical protein
LRGRGGVFDAPGPRRTGASKTPPRPPGYRSRCAGVNDTARRPPLQERPGIRRTCSCCSLFFFNVCRRTAGRAKSAPGLSLVPNSYASMVLRAEEKWTGTSIIITSFLSTIRYSQSPPSPGEAAGRRSWCRNKHLGKGFLLTPAVFLHRQRILGKPEHRPDWFMRSLRGPGFLHFFFFRRRPVSKQPARRNLRPACSAGAERNQRNREKRA